ncbi:MAG: POTRA domain-containing protein [Terracidiphilus sp.]|jgi:outer membrane translocation and assembly module TamA
MRHPAAIPIFLCLVGTALAQTSSPAPQTDLRIRTLTLISSDLPDADRQRIVSCLEGQTYRQDEFEERVRLRLRDLGYYNARTESAQLTDLRPGVREDPRSISADVSIKVEPGAQYRFGVLEFEHATLFPPAQLRSQFPVESGTLFGQAGSLFNATSISYGLDRLRNLYQAKGHVNFVAIPKTTVDEARHVVNLTIDIDEGKAYVFGWLILDGTEPHAGDGNALIASWARLQGKTYAPALLKDWLASNWPSGREALDHMHAHPDDNLGQVNIHLQFP